MPFTTKRLLLNKRPFCLGALLAVALCTGAQAFEQGNYHFVDLLTTEDEAPLPQLVPVSQEAFAGTADLETKSAIQDRGEFEIDYSNSIRSSERSSNAFNFNLDQKIDEDPAQTEETTSFGTDLFDPEPDNTIFGQP